MAHILPGIFVLSRHGSNVSTDLLVEACLCVSCRIMLRLFKQLSAQCWYSIMKCSLYFPGVLCLVQLDILFFVDCKQPRKRPWWLGQQVCVFCLICWGYCFKGCLRSIVLSSSSTECCSVKCTLQLRMQQLECMRHTFLVNETHLASRRSSAPGSAWEWQ